MIESQETQRRWDRCLLILTILCIAAYLAVFAIINIFGFVLFCDSDMYADTLIAKLMWEQKALFPHGWKYTSQYFIVGTPVFAALFYGITGDVNSAMVLATELNTVFLLLSLFWMLRAFTRDRLLHAVCCLLLISSAIAPYGPKSYNAQLFFLQASYYACYLITIFVVYGDYLRSFQRQRPQFFSFALAVYLSFATGMQSLRQTVVMVLPILACEVFQLLRRILLKESALGEAHRNHFLHALSYVAANAAGLITIKALDIPQTILYGKTQLTPFRQIPSRIPPVWDSFQKITGLDLLFPNGRFTLGSVFVLLLITLWIAMVVIWLRNIKNQETPSTLCWLLFFVGLIGTGLSSVVLTVKSREIYLFLWYPLAGLSAILILQRLSPRLKYGLILLICFLSLSNLFSSHKMWAETALLHDTTYAGRAFRLARDYELYRTYAEVDEAYSDAREMADWAMEQGYQYVYGDWYTSPRVASHSGGDLIAGFWWYQDIFKVIDYNTTLEIFDPEDNAKAVYILTDDDEQACLQKAMEQGVSMKKEAEFGCYKAYTAPVQLMRLDPQA